MGEGLCNGLRIVVVLGSWEIVGEFPRLALRSCGVAAIVIIIMWLVIWCLCFGKILKDSLKEEVFLKKRYLLFFGGFGGDTHILRVFLAC